VNPGAPPVRESAEATPGRARRALPALLVLAALSLGAAAAEDDGAATAEEPEQDPVGSVAVSGALQGKDGVRIQTLCTHCNSANIQVGGLSRELAPVSRDGFPLIGGLATSFVLSVLPADSIASTQVVKGPGEAALSNAAAGGEIDLTAATPNEVPRLDLFAETGSFSLRRAGARAAGRLASWASGSIVLGSTRTDPVDDDNDGWNDVPAVDRGFAEGELSLAPATDHALDLGVSFIDEENPEGRGAFDAFRYITEGRDSWTREDAVFDRVEFRVGWKWALRRKGTLAVRLLDATRHQKQRSQLTALDSGFFEGANELIDRFRIREQNRWGNVAYELPIGLNWRFRAGVENSRQEVQAANREPLDILAGSAADPELAEETVELLSMYVEAGWSPSPTWDVQFGLRRDEADLETRLSHPEPSVVARSAAEISPRLTVRLFPAPGWTLRLLAGRTFRPPKPILSEVCCGQRYQTTEHVRPERATTLGFEAAYVPSPRLRTSLYVASTDFDDHILRVVGWSQVFIQTYALANIPEARAQRAELALRWTPRPRLTLDASIGWLSFQNTGDERVDVIVSPPSRSSVEIVPISIGRVPYQAVRSGSVSAGWRLPNGALLGAQAGYSGSMLIQQFTRLPLNSELNTEEMRETPDFWLVNLSAEIPLNAHLVLLARVDNVTNQLQNDLGDPTSDYNWGPLAGRSWRLGLRARLD